jgi:purine-binding chemotaxis protein CheW
LSEIDPQKSLASILEELSQHRDVVYCAEKSMSSDEMRELLRQRALDLRGLELETDIGETLELLEFTLLDERFAVPLQWVGEIHSVAEITEIPGTPAFVRGVVNLHRKIFSVVDLAVLLELPQAAGAVSVNSFRGHDDGEPCLLLTLVAEEMEFAVVIDSLSGVKSLPLQDLQGCLPTLNRVQTNYFKGVTIDHLVVLDAEKLLHDKKLVVNG